MDRYYKVLFICLGNICRSPAAEGIFRAKVESKGLQDKFLIDSAGMIGYHEGELPDGRMRQHAFQRGYRLIHRSRPMKQNDFQEFDLILAMDHDNIRRLNKLQPNSPKVELITKYCSHIKSDVVPDPYYEGAEGFEHVLDLLEDACENLLNYIIDTNKITADA